jgi:hypothetical protein
MICFMAQPSQTAQKEKAPDVGASRGFGMSALHRCATYETTMTSVTSDRRRQGFSATPTIGDQALFARYLRTDVMVPLRSMAYETPPAD